MDRLRILIVEDRPADAELMVAELRRAGLPFDWQRVETERAYLAALESPLDLILADFNMPQFTGLRACRIVRERGLDIPFILVSGSIGEEIAVSALREGAADYLLKDRLTRLGAAASSALEAKRLRDKERQAEQALRDSEQRYRGLFEDVPIGLYRSTPSGQLLDVNPAMTRMLGYPDRESLLAVNAADLYVDPSERQAWIRPLEQQEIVEQYEHRLRRYDGTIIWVRGTTRSVRDAEGRVQSYQGSLEDITESKQAQEHLAEERNLLRTMTDTLPDFISVKDVESRFLLVNRAYADFLGQRPTDLIGKTVRDVFPRELAAQYIADDQTVLQSGQPILNQESCTVDRFNNARWHAVSKVPLRNSTGEPVGLVSIARDITGRKHAEALQIRLASFPELDPNPIFETDGSGVIAYMNPSAQLVFPALRPGNQLQSALSDIGTLVAQVRNGEQSSVATDVPVKDLTYQCVATHVPTADALRFYMLDITDRKRSEQQIARQLETLTALYAGAQKLSQSLDTDNLARYVVETSVKAFGARLAWVGRAEPDGTIRVLEYWPSAHAYLTTITARWDDSPSGQGPSGRAVRSRAPVVVQDHSAELSPERANTLRDLGITEVGAFPLISRDQAFGVLMLYSDRADFFNATALEFLQAFVNQAAAALENARLFDETHGRIRQLQALRNIDIAITASLDLRVTLNVILDQTTTHLKVDAANVLVFDPYTQTLRHGTNRGFRTAALRGTNLRLGEGHAGRAALEQRIISVPNLAVEMAEFARSKHLAEERFVAYMATPLLAKGQVKGVLEIFHRAPLNPTPDWLNFLETLAGQAAIAVDNSSLFENLQRANTELMLAYDTTLEGWSKALDLRDNETEGHTLRVTDLTLRLARTMGIGDEDLTHIRRGALLHDIGKMGIPDKILLKPGPLTDEEWVVMKKHPVYAYELLARIPYLRLALDIPYCHHEKWDGTGYPRGLKQEEIPRAARIFAVIDVYDALSSDRPYRKAWAPDKVVTYIREQAGKHFDPTAAAQFLAMEMP